MRERLRGAQCRSGDGPSGFRERHSRGPSCVQFGGINASVGQIAEWHCINMVVLWRGTPGLRCNQDAGGRN